MMDIILDSRINKSISNSAATAITLINLYNPFFSGMDLSNISIPSANLAYSYL
jgi:hypothetical protein